MEESAPTALAATFATAQKVWFLEGMEPAALVNYIVIEVKFPSPSPINFQTLMSVGKTHTFVVTVNASTP